jgi:hypothetical protein
LHLIWAVKLQKQNSQNLNSFWSTLYILKQANFPLHTTVCHLPLFLILVIQKQLIIDGASKHNIHVKYFTQETSKPQKPLCQLSHDSKYAYLQFPKIINRMALIFPMARPQGNLNHIELVSHNTYYRQFFLCSCREVECVSFWELLVRLFRSRFGMLERQRKI